MEVIRREGRREGRQEGRKGANRKILPPVRQVKQLNKVKHSHTGGKFFRSKRPPPQPPFALLLYDFMGVPGLRLGCLLCCGASGIGSAGKSAVWAWPKTKEERNQHEDSLGSAVLRVYGW